MKKLIFLLLILTTNFSFSQMPKILSLQEQGKLQDRWLKERFSTIIPDLMKRTEIDMWLLISREYNEDPVLKTMLPSSWLSARRTTMLVI
ncbi:MAG: Xaa-Pro aminopeptidase, partial [Bacteroidetes bacterium]|nr:Xaa-Pro aminopeptidase [Bacteroidota bacterium]